MSQCCRDRLQLTRFAISTSLLYPCPRARLLFLQAKTSPSALSSPKHTTIDLQMQQNQTKELKQLKDILVPKYIFGYRGDFKNNILQHSSSSKFIYPAANAIVTFDSDNNRSQTIISTLLGSKGVTCMAVSPSKKYVAWSEECETGIIVILDTKTGKMKTLSTLDCKSRCYVSLDFSRTEEHKYLVALSGPPEQMLIHWAWDKAKCLGSCVINAKGDNIKMTQIFYHPKEDDFVCVLGNGAIKPYKLIPDNPPKQKDSPFQKKKEIKETYSTNYLSYCILSDGKTMVVGTDQGEILYFTENCEFKLVLPTSPNDGFAIECISKYTNGFIVGGADFTVYIYRKHEGDLKNPYIKVDKKIQNKTSLSKIHSMLLTTQEENLILGVENGQIFQVQFSADRETNEEALKFEPLVASFHTDTITGLDVCIRKSLIATASQDRSIRLWNFQELGLELMKQFEDQPYSIALHPSGFHLIASFADRIVLFNIFERDLHPFKEIHIKNCQHIKFAHGGHLFAIANSNIVQVYQFFTGENPQHFVFKQQSGKIQTIEWDNDDLGFYTGGSDGFVFYWRLEDSQNKTQIAQLQNQPIDSIGVSFNEQKIYITGGTEQSQQNCIHEIVIPPKAKDALEGQKKEVVQYKINTGCQISRIALLNSEKLIFFSTNVKDQPGGLRIAKYPLTEEIAEIQPHFKGISHLKVSFDDNYVFTTGLDFSLIVYQISEEGYKIKLDKDGMGSTYAEEFLMQREIYKKKVATIEKLKAEIKEHEIKQKIKSNMYQKDRDEKIRDLDDQIETQQRNDKAKFDELYEGTMQLQRQFEEEKKKLIQQHEMNKRTTESDFKQKMQLEQQRYEELVKEKDAKRLEFQNNMAAFKQHCSRLEKEKRQYYEEQLRKEKELFEQLNRDKEEMQKKFVGARNSLEDQAERDIDRLKEINESEMKKLSDELDKAELEKRAKKTEFDTAKQQLEQANSKLKEIMEDITQNQEINRQYQKEKESHDKEIKERDKTIQDKQRRIYELKKKTQELEKFKFVLDYKIKELKREIGPREEEISKMKEQIANMQTEILHFLRINANLNLIVTDLHLRQAGMKEEIDKQSIQIDNNNQYIKAFEYDISETHACLSDFKSLKQSMLKLFTKYVQSEQSKKKFENIDLQKEFIKERAHLETTNKGLKEKFQKKLRVHKQDNNRIMGQNVDLISEINDLRREIKLLQDEEALKELNARLLNNRSEGELQSEIEENDMKINALRERIELLRQQGLEQRQQQQMQVDSERNNNESDFE